MSRIVVLTTTYLDKPYANGVCARHLIRALRRLGNEVNVVCYSDKIIPEEDVGYVYPIKKPDMSRFLILSSYYLGAATANGICAKNIAFQLKQSGHEVFVLCYASGDAQENIFTVAPPAPDEKRNLIEKVWGRVRATVSPKLNKSLKEEYEARATRICEEKNIDTVIAMFFPFETVSALAAIKKRFPRIRTVIYELDSVGDGISSGSSYQKLLNRATERWNRAQYRLADRIIVMESHRDYWNKTFGKKYGEKLLLADIPVLVQKDLPQMEKDENEPISLLYGGLIEQSYRSPDHLLKVFEHFSRAVPATLDFFSKGDCEEKIAQIAKSVEGIRQNGYVPEAVLNEAIAKADVLVSIGNRVSRSVPSKLITYLSYGKPVLHISLQKDDVCAEYLKRYPLGLVLNEWESVEENAKKLFDFVQKTSGKTVSFSDIEKALQKNTPQFSAEIICKE